MNSVGSLKLIMTGFRFFLDSRVREIPLIEVSVSLISLELVYSAIVAIHTELWCVLFVNKFFENRDHLLTVRTLGN